MTAMTERSSTIMGRPEALILALAALPVDLERTLQGHSAEALLRPASDGGWGVVENLCHLRDWEEVFAERVEAILHQERPWLPAFDDELWAIERDYRGQNPARVLDRFRELRSRLVDQLTGLPSAAWTRTGEHEVHGLISLEWLIDHVRDHGEQHLAQIRDALA